jgi:hypothetical protein
VIGYLPGRGTNDTVDDRMVYSVTSDLLHSWPEVFFEGIGWVAFEPTNSLGAPPVFASGGSTPTGPQDAGPAIPVPTSAPSAAPTERADTPNAPSAGGPTGDGGLGALWPATGVLALLIVLLLVPALARAVWRHRQRAAARSGDATSTWLAVQSIAIDLGIPVPSSESPRAFGGRLIARGAPADAVSALVSAVERASYAPAGYTTAGRIRGDRSLDDALAAVSAGLREHAAPLQRSLAAAVPRSLLIRPGSAAADAGEGARLGRP